MVEQTTWAMQARDRLLLSVLYVGFFGVVFVLALYWTFPYDRLRDFIAAKLSAPEGSTTGQSVEIGELTPTGLGGVRVRDLTFTQTSATPDAPPSVLHLSEITAKVSILPLLFGSKKVDLQARAGAGTLDGKLDRSSDAQKITAEFSGLDLGDMGLGSWLSLPLKGRATGNVDLNVPNADVTKTTGTVTLEVAGLHVSDGKSKIKPPGMAAGFTLDEIDAGKLKLGVDVRDGTATLSRLSADGRDLKLSGKGNVRLSDPWKRSRPDLDLDLTFSDVYKNKSDRTKAMFDLLGFQPEWQRATTPDGTMHVHIGGTFLAIRGGPGR
jgi:type II secretion system protein N